MAKKIIEYRIMGFTPPEFKSTHSELRKYIDSLHSRCKIANVILAGYEHKINVLETKNEKLVSDNMDMTIIIKDLSRKIASLEAEKYPPMDKIKTLPVIKDEDLPFLDEDNSLTEDLRNEIHE